MWSRWGQAVRAPIAIEAGTAGWEARLGSRQTQATMVAVIDATGRGSLAASGAFKTLWRGGEMSGKDLVLFFPLPLKQTSRLI